MESNTILKHPLLKKQQYLQDIRHELKKKRFILDESKDNFGMDSMSQLVKVKNTSQVKGYPFKVHKDNLLVTKGMKLALKVVPIELKYEKNEHPCNIENLVLKELTDNILNKQISPHITYYLTTQKVSNKCRALKHINLKRLEVEEKIRTHSNMLISEYVDGGSLDKWIFDVYENDENISDEQWKSLVFQLVYTISIIQKYYRMMHNDFHYGNILIDNSIAAKGYFVYEINNKKYYIKNNGVIPKLWDFEFSMVYSDKIQGCYPNKFITGPYEYDKKTHTTLIDNREKDEHDDNNVPYNYNEVYDVHYFLTSLLDLYISQDLFDWILSIYPEEVIPSDESSSDSSSRSSYSKSDTDTESESVESELETDTESDSVESDTESETESKSSDESSSDFETDSDINKDEYYIKDGRLKNGIENEIKLPTPLDLIHHTFFECFTKIPEDFDENEAIYFKAGF